ncbi:hypothetical protein D5086_002911 [Populus alba]|uniref:Nucleotide-diphospho-sugar transferase domain-containing protein n=2 Tax=Populus alba TaxID=43335 RepID=A0A4U5NAA2_POPAL|nr:hypothetical protein D5086_0000271320 [Populus alba]
MQMITVTNIQIGWFLRNLQLIGLVLKGLATRRLQVGGPCGQEARALMAATTKFGGPNCGGDRRKLQKWPRAASTPGRIVILTVLDKSWARPGSVLDLFLESFQIGEGTEHLLNHLVIVGLDFQAFQYCQTPFPILVAESEITIGCDSKSSNQSSINKYSRGGFFFIKSDFASLEFLEVWNLGRFLHPNMATASVCQRIIDEGFVEMVGLRTTHIEPSYCGGLCEPGKDTSEIYALNATCCSDLDSKVHGLNLVLDNLVHEESRMFNALLVKDNSSASPISSGRAQMKCSTS